MNTTNKLIGKKVKGFKFEDSKYNGLSFQNEMDNYIGKVGIIDNYNKNNNRCRVEFDDVCWHYPAELIEQHLVEETPLDDLPIIGDGVLMEVSDDEEDWYKAEVYCKIKDTFIAYLKANDTINQWQYARPITSKTKITRKEFESKFEIID
jgi:hypothetical protein